MNELKIFQSPEFGEVRTIIVDGEIWFVGNDVARALGYQKTNEAVRKKRQGDGYRYSGGHGFVG